MSQALIMGTVMVANASAFAPNVQKGLLAAANIIKLFERVPKVQDDKNAEEIVEVKGQEFHFNKSNKNHNFY